MVDNSSDKTVDLWPEPRSRNVSRERSSYEILAFFIIIIIILLHLKRITFLEI